MGDILANLAGSSIGLYSAYYFERQYRARREIESLYAPLDVEAQGEDDVYDIGDWDGAEELPERFDDPWRTDSYENTQSSRNMTEPVFQLDDQEELDLPSKR